MSLDYSNLHAASPDELVAIGAKLGLPLSAASTRAALLDAILRAHGEAEGARMGHGVLEVHTEGFGFLRSAINNFLPGEGDIYVSQSQIRRFKMRTGDYVIGHVRAPKAGENFEALLRVEATNGQEPSNDPDFKPITLEQLTAMYPDDRVELGRFPSLKALDFAAPIGLGQRGIALFPSGYPRDEVLKDLATALAQEEDLQVTVLLMGERPEAIEEWRRLKGLEVIATPFEETWARHLQVADIVFERARRQVEAGENVALIVDSLTRLLRAAQGDQAASGRTIGGVDAAALGRIRKYLSAARAISEGGSLTMIGVLQETSADTSGAVLYEDLLDVCNWTAVFSRDLANQGLPPLDLLRSGTAREERLLTARELKDRRNFRRALTGDTLANAKVLAQAITPA